MRSDGYAAQLSRVLCLVIMPSMIVGDLIIYKLANTEPVDPNVEVGITSR
jgi:hypothetical protein